MSNAKAAASSSGGSLPLVSIIAGIWAYMKVPILSATGAKGVLGAGLIGVGTGICASVLGFVGAIGGLVVGGATFAAAGALVGRGRGAAAGGIAGGIGGMLVGGITGTVLGITNGYGVSKDFVLEEMFDQEPIQIEQSISSLSDMSISQDANEAFTSTAKLTGFDATPTLTPVKAKPVAFAG